MKNEKIKETISQLKVILSREKNINFAFLFGSYATGRYKKDSDIDVAIHFKNSLEGLDLLDFTNKLSNLIKKDIHLVVLNNSSAFLRHQVMKYGVLLTKKEKLIYRRFREKTIMDYDEYKFISGMNIYD